jgi:protein gp37
MDVSEIGKGKQDSELGPPPPPPSPPLNILDPPPFFSGEGPETTETQLSLELGQSVEDAKSSTYYTLDAWKNLSKKEKNAILGNKGSTGFNKQDTDSIKWARWSWNPVSGCRHNCSYCYARDIANRFYEQGFEPSFWPQRLNAPHVTKVPAIAEQDVGWKNVFTCSMADLFGRWVPQEWIDAVLKECADASQWNFLFLTKFPKRLAEIDFPQNAWVGTTIDSQKRVAAAEEAFSKVKAAVKWISVEPYLEPHTFTDLSMFQWVVIGGSSKSSQTPEWKPPREWVQKLEEEAKQAGCKVYEKENLIRLIQHYPGYDAAEPMEAPKELFAT